MRNQNTKTEKGDGMKFSGKKLRKDERKEILRFISKMDYDLHLYFNAKRMSKEEIYQYAKQLYLDQLKPVDPVFNANIKWMSVKKFRKKYGDSYDIKFKYNPDKTYYENMRKYRKKVEKHEVMEEIQDTDVILMNALNGSLTERVIHNKTFRKELKALCKDKGEEPPNVLRCNFMDYIDENNNMDVYANMTNKRGH